jgi:hypothetical protein
MLNHLVVQTIAGIQKYLKFLRKHTMDCANFVPLNKMTPWLIY